MTQSFNADMSFDKSLDFFCEDRPWHLQAILPQEGGKAIIKLRIFPSCLLGRRMLRNGVVTGTICGQI